MALEWAGITHITKVDPAKAMPAELSVLEGTDLVVVGGSDGVTAASALETIQTVSRAVPETPVLQEPSSPTHVSRATVDAVDAIAVPAVYNGDRDHFVGKHVDMFTELGRNVASVAGEGTTALLETPILGEGYVIQHLESTAAAASGVETAYTPEQVVGAALATETVYDFPIFYLEYAGRYGGPTDVAAAACVLEETTLLYGGGIDSREKATEILAAGADAIVVGDCFHDDLERFRETIPTT
ncbi:heptaprenylglyceryl phosphate synthase [Natronorubrum sulfidifaciens]|uniref:phosphoglycerol geranylgeranyltransferase n=1 Tax=Natronorubrum sulfidifaciens JCM 14089 TaxID=1230460 RepID=L9W2D3_9EURY|nr:heptaprenylglyceryl phosphate synthase [Natronorubrum sulfidifaciens]ELY43659.1 geranylgeranylglyceryl phosphate synthase-like protein [Natronorubrum sulfidifaciens JCM 14089]